jgi:DNA-binding NtrC family response regulator
VRNHRPQLRLPAEAVAATTRYRWSGKVRELRNAIERATVLSQGDEIRVEHLLASVLCDKGPAAIWPSSSLEEIKREHILLVLSESPRLEDAAATPEIDTVTPWRKRKRTNWILVSILSNKA